MSEPGDTIERVWREHRFALVARLAARFNNLSLAEDALSEALVAAQTAWRDTIPSSPVSWLYAVAKRKALDETRKVNRHEAATPSVERHVMSLFDTDPQAYPEERLGLFFHCAHPSLSPDARVALMLYHVAGLSPERIARSFMTSTSTIHQRLKRARDKLKACAVSLEPPLPVAWPERLPIVLSAIEVIYDQSYSDVSGDIETAALGRDALQLADTLCHLLPGEAEVFALLAMLETFEARRPARLSPDGAFIPLNEQDPDLWNHTVMMGAAQSMIQAILVHDRGQSHLGFGPYCLRTRIQTFHALGRRDGSDHSKEILECYDRLLEFQPSPVIEVNRALALAEVHGAEAGLAALDEIDADLENLASWHLARAELLNRTGDTASAVVHLRKALPLISGRAERAYVEKKLNAVLPN